ncbi:MAG: choice-of-anchor R domain-containing protein [Candidatus Udaeobacter sp.]
MRRKTFITSCCLVTMMACGTAFAQQGKIKSGPFIGAKVQMGAVEAPAAVPFYSNLVNNTCTSCNYSSTDGFFVLGPNNCAISGATQWLAYPFTSLKSGAVRQVQLAITNDTAICTPTSSRFTVQIYDDACAGVPNNPLGTAVVATAAAAPCALAAANFGHAGVTLTAGGNYWVVVTTNSTPQQIATTAVWWQINASADSFNLNDGNGWVAGPLGGPGAFSVQ